MFKITLSDVDLMKNSIPIIADIIDEGNFTFDENGMGIISPDRTMVAVVDLKILSSAFDEYKINEGVTLGMNLGNLSAVLKRAKSGDKMTLEYEKGNRMKIILEKSGKKREFEIPILDIKAEKPPIDQLTFAGTAELDTSILEDGIADAEVIGDSIFMEASGDILKMHSKGDTSSAKIEVKKGKELLSLTAEKAIKSQYPLDYLKKMIKAGKLSKQMMIEFGTDYPMRLSFKVIDKLRLSFVLAPRVSED